MKRVKELNPGNCIISVLRDYYYNPQVEISEDIKNEKGVLVYKAGTKIKVYEGVKFDDLLFVDGTCVEQLVWAVKRQEMNPNQTIMLTGGRAETLSKKYGIQMYKDTSCYFTEKFGIKSVPAIVTQEKGERNDIRVREFIILNVANDETQSIKATTF